MSLQITVDNRGAFVAHCRLSWLQDDVQQQLDEQRMASGMTWSFTLPEGNIRNLQLQVQHETNLVWQPRRDTGTLLWPQPAAQFSGGEAEVEIRGTALVLYEVIWTNH